MTSEIDQPTADLTLRAAQELVRQFAAANGWQDTPEIDKFDHLHEELVEMSRLLRYHSPEERQQIIRDHAAELTDGIGDLLFGVCRLANQLGVDAAEAFAVASASIQSRYAGKVNEHKE